MQKFLGLGVLLSLLSARPAYAYLDPAAGSLALQAIIAGVAGVLVAVKLYWTRLKSLWSRFVLRRKTPHPTPQPGLRSTED